MKQSPLALLAGAVLLQLGAFLILFHGHGGSLVDDAYISFRYAARWAESRGWTWNDGAAVEGFSNPLWTLLLGVIDRIGGPAPDRVAPWLGLALLAGTTALLVSLARARRLSTVGSSLLVGGTVLDVGLSLWSGSGLEVPLAACLVAAVLRVSAARTIRFREGLGLGVLASGLFLCRPEGMLWAGWLLAWLIWGAWVPRRALAGWGLGMVPAAAYLAFRLLTFGSLFPNTFFAKLEPTFLGVPAAGRDLGVWGLAHAVPLAWGAWGWFRSPRRTPGPVGPRLWPLLPAGWVVGEVAFTIVAGGDWMGKTRYLAAVIPAFYAWAAEAFTANPVASHGGEASSGGRGTRGRGWGKPAVRHALIPAALLVHGGLGWVTRDAIPTYTVQGRELGMWLREVAAPTDTVAVTAAGAIPYFSGLPALDVLGINDPGVRGRPARHTGSWAPGHHRYDLAGLLECKPTWVVWDFGVAVNRYRLRQFAARSLLDDSARARLDYRRALLADPEFSARYAIDESAPPTTRNVYTVFRRR